MGHLRDTAMPRGEVLKRHQAVVGALAIVQQLLGQLHSFAHRDGLARRLALPYHLCHLEHCLGRDQTRVPCRSACHDTVTASQEAAAARAEHRGTDCRRASERGRQGRVTIVEGVEREFGRQYSVLPHQVKVGRGFLLVAKAIFDGGPHVAGDPVPIDEVVQ